MMILTCILHVLLPEAWQRKLRVMTVLKRNPRIYQYLSDTFFGNADKINQEKIAKKSQSIPLSDVDHHFIGLKQLVEEQKKVPNY